MAQYNITPLSRSKEIASDNEGFTCPRRVPFLVARCAESKAQASADLICPLQELLIHENRVCSLLGMVALLVC
jgi:hypothetical protein